MSLQHASLIKGKGVIRLLKLERKASLTGKGAREGAEEGNDDETRRQRSKKMQRLIGEKGGGATDVSLGVKARWSAGRGGRLRHRPLQEFILATLGAGRCSLKVPLNSLI